ncbi:ABC transporter substrate-binding protein [Heyndrickxia sp. FSL K6-6286]|uniref:ABC transporter substrate-binding protein n=1 Tax=Heyndrickxia TaxID=2837504 RepID=UPI0015D1F0D3|nr:ABC transporter substrate-binding protein [Heyndrickxia oleronia]MBU5212071.1 ABC transporter substrate-binding protein [Heyndrickxia oleronia]NYV67925.1 carbohydrate ABC transporter substrate-binding protein [Bacillus sp. Gen3]
MKVRRLLPAMLALILLVSIGLVGCSSSNDDSKEGKGSSKGDVVVDIFQFKVEFKDQFKKLAEKYEKENKGVKINITTVGGGEDYGAALKSKFASGNEPTIYNVGGPQDVKDWEAKLADLSDTKAASLALDGTLEGVKKGDEILGLPYNQEGYGFIYNTKVFEKAGIDPKEITSFSALEDAVKTLDKKKKDLGLDAVFALPGKETWVTGLHLSNTFLAPEFNGNVMDAYNAKKVDFKYADAFKHVLDLENKYSVQPTVSLDYSQQVEELFSTGKVAMIQQGNWVYGSIEGIDPELAENSIGLLPIPVEGYKEDAIPVGVPMYWAVNKNKNDKEITEAKKFLDWLYTSDAGKEAVINDFKFIPAYDGFDASKISDPLAKAVYNYAKDGKTIAWVFMGYPTGWGQEQLGINIQKYISGKMSWADLVNESKKSWEAAR